MEVGELRKQGFKVIAGDTLANGLSESIKLSIGGAIAVNEGHHDDLEIVDLIWRDKTSEDLGFHGNAEYSLDGWRPYLGLPSSAYEPKVSIDEKPAFTQAMANTGEFPPVGIELIIVNKTECQRIDEFIGEPILIINACEYKNKYVITWFHPTHGLCCGNYNNKTFNVFDARTKKEKAVDAAIAEWPVADKATLELAYDLWTKEIEQ